MIKSVFATGALALLSLSAPAAGSSPDNTQTPAATAADPNTEKVVCRRVEAIGTRLASKRVCRTKAQWDAEAAANRQDMDRTQTQRYKDNT